MDLPNRPNGNGMKYDPHADSPHFFPSTFRCKYSMGAERRVSAKFVKQFSGQGRDLGSEERRVTSEEQKDLPSGWRGTKSPSGGKREEGRVDERRLVAPNLSTG